MNKTRDFVTSVWPTNELSARADQEHLARSVTRDNFDLTSVRIALAIGLAYSEATSLSFAVGLPCTCSAHPLVDEPYVAARRVEFPYVAGMFAYREGPAVEQLVKSLHFIPDLLIFDAQGLAHPRRFGLATHLGFLLGLPSIGVTRTRLIGRYENPPKVDKARTPLYGRKDEIIGFTFRALANCNTIFVSPGYRTSLDSIAKWLDSLKIIRSCFPGAVGKAHEYANRLARMAKKLENDLEF